MTSTARVFLLSPARCDGRRARMLERPASAFALAGRLRQPGGAALGDVFAFLSGLYFRGKLVYATAFARPPHGMGGVFVITPGSGLREPHEPVDLEALGRFARIDVHEDEPAYSGPLRDDVARLASVSAAAEIVLLGSIATRKYVDVLLPLLGERLVFPREFVGRGDMSRGGLLLRAAEARVELEYVPVAGATRRGARPPRLPRRS